MKKIFVAASSYAALGLCSGVLYRSATHNLAVIPKNQLATTHTHFLALGMFCMLICMSLEAAFKVTASRCFQIFFWTYNVGLLISAGAMIWHGFIQISGERAGRALAGIAGIGHILIAVGIVALLFSLAKALKKYTAEI